MSVRKLLSIASLVLITSVATPGNASADWLFTPFVGWNWGGTANLVEGVDFDDEFEQKAMFGASLGWMGAGLVGFEVDLGYSPNFFEQTVGSGNFDFGDSNLTTLMGNLIIGVPIGGQRGPGFRPYAVGGLGIIKSRIDGAEDLFEVDSTNWGFNVGAGAIFFFSDNVGVRGDVRYFRSLQDDDIDDLEDLFDIGLANFRFWRGTAGVTIRF
jgi:opacity protein-like surface antigen